MLEASDWRSLDHRSRLYTGLLLWIVLLILEVEIHDLLKNCGL